MSVISLIKLINKDRIDYIAQFTEPFIVRHNENTFRVKELIQNSPREQRKFLFESFPNHTLIASYEIEGNGEFLEKAIGVYDLVSSIKATDIKAFHYICISEKDAADFDPKSVPKIITSYSIERSPEGLSLPSVAILLSGTEVYAIHTLDHTFIELINPDLTHTLILNDATQREDFLSSWVGYRRGIQLEVILKSDYDYPALYNHNTLPGQVVYPKLLDILNKVDGLKGVSDLSLFDLDIDTLQDPDVLKGTLGILGEYIHFDAYDLREDRLVLHCQGQYPFVSLTHLGKYILNQY